MDDYGDLELCVLCTKAANPNGIQGVLGNREICRLLSIATGNTFEKDPALPNWLCRNCLLHTNLHLEYQKRIWSNLMKLRINYFFRNGDHQRVKELKDSIKQSRTSRRFIDQRLINALREPDECSSTTNESASIVINDVRTILGSPPATPVEPNTNFDYNTDDVDMHSEVSSSSEQNDVSWSLLIPTREQFENISVTESGGDIHLRSEQATQRKVRHECNFCGKSYRRHRNLDNHLRKHNAVLRAKERLSKVSERPAQFQCSVLKCQKIFPSLQLLRSHSEKHKITFPCMTCSKTFTLKNDLSWHNAECQARQQVLKDVHEGVVNMRKPMRPRTRSKSLLESTTESIHPYALSDVSIVDSLHLQRIARTKKRKATVHDDDNNITESESSSSGSSNSSSVQRRTHKNDRKQCKAEKRKARRLGVDFYKCSSCSFGTRSLSETMRHEQRDHNLLLNFYCKLCKDWYTTQDNLIRHRKKHIETRYCDFCDEAFDSQFDLEYHLLLHYENSFDCNHCHMSFLGSVDRDRHIFNGHRGEVAKRPLNASRRQVSPYKFSGAIPFSGYKTKDLLQKPSINAKILPPRRRELVWKMSRNIRAQLGGAAGIRKPGVTMCSEYFESFNCAELDAFEAGRQECNATPSLFADYTGSPLTFDRTDDVETVVSVTTCDSDKDVPDVIPVHTSDDDDSVYEVLDGMKVFFTEPLRDSSDNVVSTANSLEPDVIVIDDSDDDDDNPADCISLPTRQPHRMNRQTDLPIQIGERFIPSYEEYVPQEPGTSERLVEEIDIDQPLNRPFRYIP